MNDLSPKCSIHSSAEKNGEKVDKQFQVITKDAQTQRDIKNCYITDWKLHSEHTAQPALVQTQTLGPAEFCAKITEILCKAFADSVPYFCQFLGLFWTFSYAV